MEMKIVRNLIRHCDVMVANLVPPLTLFDCQEFTLLCHKQYKFSFFFCSLKGSVEQMLFLLANYLHALLC